MTDEIQKIINTGENIMQLNQDNLIQRIIDNNEVQNFIYDAIKALQAYQRPTSEEVEDAIEMQEWHIKEENDEWDKTDDEWKCEPGAEDMHNDVINAHNLAIKALKAYQEPQFDKEKENEKD